MITLEQIKTLENKIAKAVEVISALKQDNTKLKGEKEVLQARVNELESSHNDFVNGQDELEKSILGAISKLDELDSDDESSAETLPETSVSPSTSEETAIAGESGEEEDKASSPGQPEEAPETPQNNEESNQSEQNEMTENTSQEAAEAPEENPGTLETVIIEESSTEKEENGVPKTPKDENYGEQTLDIF